MVPIHLFVPTFRVDETLAEIRECLEKGWTGLGYKTIAFEDAWCRYAGLPHAHFLNSATAGLQLAVRLLKERDGWADGDEIVSTPLTFVSTNHVILHERMRPVFADVDEYLCLDPESIAARITPRTRAVMFVGLGGNTGRLDRVLELCRARGLRLILDAAHMAGTRWHGRHVGAACDVAVFSFHAVKNLPTADSGMICFADAALDALVRRWTWVGINKDTYTRTSDAGAYRWQYDVDHVGFKAHGNSIMAAMALVALPYLDRDNAYRRTLCALYDDLVDGTVQRVPVGDGCESARHLYQILVDDRDQIMLGLNELGIFPGVHYRDNTTYPMYASMRGTCPRAAHASDRLISLPLHLQLTRDDVARVAAALAALLARRGQRT